MAQNPFLIQRVAFGNVTVPTILSVSNTESRSASVAGKVYIPTGALITGIKLFAADALTLSQAKNATINVYVGQGTASSAYQPLLTNNVVASGKIVQTNLHTAALFTANAVPITVGGYLIVSFGSSDSDGSAVAADADLYVEYLYCSDRDTN